MKKINFNGKNLLSYFFILLSFGFIVYTFSKIDLRVITQKITFGWIPYLMLFSFLYSLIVILRAYNWTRILRFLSPKITDTKSLLSIYAKTEIAKYIPSNVMHFAGRHALARKKGYSHTVLVFSNLLDLGFVLLMALSIVFLGLILKIIPLPEAVLKWLSLKRLLFIGGAGAIVSAALFFLKRKTILSKIRPFLNLSSLYRFILIFFLFLPVFLICGGILFGIFTLLLGNDFSLYSYLYAFMGFSLAWAAGFVIPGAPGGLGIRETMLILLFSPLYGNTQALIAALILRIITIAGDALGFFYSLRINREISSGSDSR
jgi:uncharacterized membrane protein YbhN (UPF0104 family)